MACVLAYLHVIAGPVNATAPADSAAEPPKAPKKGSQSLQFAARALHITMMTTSSIPDPQMINELLDRAHLKVISNNHGVPIVDAKDGAFHGSSGPVLMELEQNPAQVGDFQLKYDFVPSGLLIFVENAKTHQKLWVAGPPGSEESSPAFVETAKKALSGSRTEHP